MKIKKYVFALLLGFLAIPVIASQNIAFANSAPELEAKDIMVGENNFITAKNLFEKEAVKFYFVMADGTDLILDATADIDKEARVELFGYHTKVSGIYRVELLNENNKKIAETYFKAIPAESSTSKSSIIANKKSAKANGSDSINIKVYLKDKYGNPIIGNPVKLISSKPSDYISKNGRKLTDSDGVAEFNVKSKSTGISVFTAMDGITEKTLDDRLEAIFFTSADFESAGGDELIAQSVAPIEKFEILELPEEVYVGEAYDFIVKASGSEGERITNYIGTIQLSSTDEDAEYLEEYTFMPQELGQHKFALGIKFSTTGEQELSVIDADDANIIGTATVTVLEKSGGEEEKPAASEPKITSLSDGEKTNQKSIEISGTGAPESNAVFFDGNSEIGNVEVDSDGNFSYIVSNLEEGEHTISVMVIPPGQETGPISENVSVFIDTKAPVINDFLEPNSEDIKSGEDFQIGFKSDDEIKSAVLGFNNEEIDFTKMEDSSYEITATAPEDPGEYPVSVKITDDYGNEEIHDLDPIVIEEPSVTPETEPETEPAVGPETEPAVEPETEPIKPTEPTGIEIKESESKISLSWEVPEESENPIDHFKIYFGVDENALNQTKETQSRTTGYTILGLLNGIDYYFSVASVAADGTESEITPVIKASPKGEEGIITDEVVPEKQPESGPAETLALVLAFSFSLLLVRKMKKA